MSTSDLVATIQAVLSRSTQPGAAVTTDEYAQLLASVDVSAPAAASVPPHVRVKAVTMIGQFGATVDSMVRNTLTTLVTLLAAPEHVAPLQIAAVNALASIAEKLPTKQFEFVREVSDVFIQINLEQNGFAPHVRAASKAGLDQLLKINFRGVLTKLLHLLSDERERDEAAYLQQERQFALDMLHHLITAPNYSDIWTEETQNHVVKYSCLVFPVLSPDQYSRLATIVAHMPIVKAKNGAPLVDAVIGSVKVDSLRSYQALALLAPHVTRTAVHDALAAKLFPLAPDHMSSETGSATVPASRATFGKALFLASRLCSEAQSAVYLPIMAGIVQRMPLSDWTAAEACLMALSSLGHRNAVAALPVVHGDAFVARAAEILAAVTAVKDKATAAILGLVSSGQATEKHGEAHACLANVAAMAEAFSKKKLPTMAMQTSWDGRKALPRAGAPVPLSGVAPGAIYKVNKRGRN